MRRQKRVLALSKEWRYGGDMEKPGFTERDRKRVAELGRIWERMQEEDDALRRTTKLTRLYMALVALVFVPTVVLSGGNPLVSPWNWIFFGSAAVFLYGAWKLFNWYATAVRRLIDEFREKYGEEARRLAEKEQADSRSGCDTDTFS